MSRQVCVWLTARFQRGRFASGRANFLVQSVFSGFVATPAGFAFRIWALVRVWIFTMLTVKVRPGFSVRPTPSGLPAHSHREYAASSK